MSKMNFLQSDALALEVFNSRGLIIGKNHPSRLISFTSNQPTLSWASNQTSYTEIRFTPRSDMLLSQPYLEMEFPALALTDSSGNYIAYSQNLGCECIDYIRLLSDDI
jgi:hypothetical protein